MVLSCIGQYYILQIYKYIFYESDLLFTMANRFYNNILLSLASTITITEYVSNPAFASSAGIPISIASSAVGLKICAITAGMKSICQ